METKRDFFTVEVEVDERVIAVELVKVRPFIEPFGIRREPAAMLGVVKATAVENEGVDLTPFDLIEDDKNQPR